MQIMTRNAADHTYRDFADGGASLALGNDAPTAPQGLPANCYFATMRRSAREHKL